ncbi:MAG: WD40/YVTN/BNR-like repeat-containing protein [Streptosporangiaceae bacterium]
MISATTGWALLWTANPNTSAAVVVGRTTDGGRTWHLLSPPARSAARAGGLELLGAVSAERAWTAAAAPVSAGGKTELFLTNDGGRSWRRSEPVLGAEPVAADFVGSCRGWLLESLGAAMGSNPVRIYRTTDGGLRWSLLARSQAFGRSAPNSSGLRLTCDKIGIAFRSPRTGWIGTECTVGYSVLVSRDGGSHWSSQQLPIPQSACEQAGCVVSAPQFAGHTTFLPVSDYPDAALLFVSADAGASWRTMIMPRGAGPYPRVNFFSQSDGIAVSAGSQGTVGPTFYVTSDAGLSWTAVPQGKHFGRSGANFDFVGPTTGLAWLVPGISPNSAAPKMYRTSNSGRTWISFVPRLA